MKTTGWCFEHTNADLIRFTYHKHVITNGFRHPRWAVLVRDREVPPEVPPNWMWKLMQNNYKQNTTSKKQVKNQPKSWVGAMVSDLMFIWPNTLNKYNLNQFDAIFLSWATCGFAVPHCIIQNVCLESWVSWNTKAQNGLLIMLLLDASVLPKTLAQQLSLLLFPILET